LDREALAKLHQNYLACGLTKRNDEMKCKKYNPAGLLKQQDGNFISELKYFSTLKHSLEDFRFMELTQIKSSLEDGLLSFPITDFNAKENLIPILIPTA
jgi:hypothetical protein